MSNGNGFLQDARGNRSTGRALAWTCVGAGIGCFAAGIAFRAEGSLPFKAGVALLVAGWTFYSGGKGLDALLAKVGFGGGA